MKKPIYGLFFIVIILLSVYLYYNTKQKNLYLEGVRAYKSHDYTQAILYFDKLIAIDPNNSRVYNSKGGVLGAMGEYDEALVHYNQSLLLDNNDYLPHANKFCPLYNLKRYQEAVETCNRAIELEPNRVNIYEVYTNRAMALNKLERYEEALEDAEAALRLVPDYVLALNAKAVAERYLELED